MVGGLIICALAVGCASEPSSEADAPSPVAPVTTGTTLAPSTASVAPSLAVDATIAPSTAAVSGSIDPGTAVTSTSVADLDHRALSDTSIPLVRDVVNCAPGWSDLTSDGGEITFSRDGDLYSFDPASGDLRCLAHVDRDPHRLDWNPAGDRLLVDDDLIVSADGPRPSGFSPGTIGISWTQPKGTSLIAPSVDGSAVRHVSASNPADEIDVSSLTTTWAAAYHPSGLAVASAGIDSIGRAGLFLADNRGRDPQLLVFLDDPATRITEIAFGPTGDWIVFVHDHTAGTVEAGVAAHIHRLQLPGLGLEDVASLSDVVPNGLIASEQVDATVAWQQESAITDVQALSLANDVSKLLGFAEMITRPVGFYADGTVVATVFPMGGSGAGQAWAFPPAGDPILIANGISAAATRTIHHPNWTDPPLDLEARAVG